MRNQTKLSILQAILNANPKMKMFILMAFLKMNKVITSKEAYRNSTH